VHSPGKCFHAQRLRVLSIDPVADAAPQQTRWSRMGFSHIEACGDLDEDGQPVFGPTSLLTADLRLG
jgi:hypothetical protein